MQPSAAAERGRAQPLAAARNASARARVQPAAAPRSASGQVPATGARSASGRTPQPTVATRQGSVRPSDQRELATSDHRARVQAQAAPRKREPAPAVASTPAARPTITDDSAAACYAALDGAGVTYRKLSPTAAAGVAWPIQLSAPLGGVRIHGGEPNAPTNYLDCRLARALLAWAPQLTAAGVSGLAHYSMFRKNAVVAGGQNPSGHAHGFAIDVAFFELRDGRRLSVLDDWKQRTRGAAPCAEYADTAETRLMRELVCTAAEQQLFQVVLTPHYNDAHANHVHLEIGTRGGDAYVR